MATITRVSNRRAAEPTDYVLIDDDSGQKLRIYQRKMLVAGLQDYGIKDTSRRQVALLLGRYSKDGGWVDVVTAVKVRAPEGQFADENIWREARKLAASREPGLEVVGWAITHPNMGAELKADEREVHTRYFPSSYHVVYVSDPVSAERRFYYQQSGRLMPAGGFRVYGNRDNHDIRDKVEAEKMEQGPIKHQDDRVRERFLEHGLDKIIKRLDNPMIRNIDWVIIGLLVLVLGIVLLRPQPKATFDEDMQKKISTMAVEVSALNNTLTRLESELKASKNIDSEVKLTGTVTEAGMKEAAAAAGSSSMVTPTPAASTSASAKTGRKVGGASVGSKVTVHTVASGDTLYSICEQYYGTASTEMAEALGRYNNLEAPNYDLYPGDPLKVPDESVLKQ
ncbi:LysM peptidoglycan-binding domain-containing protein [bacterium]|nr:LysM peptidoglycan-binding domain-containing protein [bacterium]